MKRVRRSVALVVLLLVLALLLGPAVQAGRPPMGEVKTVTFDGADILGEDNLTVESKRNGVTVYGPTEGVIELEFSGSRWLGFEGTHGGKLRITLKDGDATLYFDFDWYRNKEVQADVPLYHLEGFGTCHLDGQTYQIALDDTLIYEVEAHRRGKKGALGLEFTKPIPIVGAVLFGMTIEG